MLNALEYVLGIYGLSFAITMVVWTMIVAIRWVSGRRPDFKATAAKR